MRYLPFVDFELHTNLTADEVFHRLRAIVDTKRKWLIFTNKPLWGEVNRNHFRIWRDTWQNHNFSPIVSGKIQSESSGSCLKVRMRMRWFGFWFYLLILAWLWVSYFAVISNLIVQKIQTGVWQIDLPWMFLPAIGMFAFAYLLSVGTFMSETKKIKRYLLQLLETTEENIKYEDRIFGITESQIIGTIFLVTLFTSLGWILYNLFWR